MRFTADCCNYLNNLGEILIYSASGMKCQGLCMAIPLVGKPSSGRSKRDISWIGELSNTSQMQPSLASNACQANCLPEVIRNSPAQRINQHVHRRLNTQYLPHRQGAARQKLCRSQTLATCTLQLRHQQRTFAARNQHAMAISGQNFARLAFTVCHDCLP